MKKYLISLEKDQHRRDLFFAQPNTSDFILFSAINTMKEEVEALHKRFDFAKFLQRYQRNVTKGEIGCTLSHLGVYQQIVEDEHIAEQDYCLVCEDDALFSHNFSSELEGLLAHGLKADFVLVGQSKIGGFDSLELEINYPTTFKFLQKKLPNSPLACTYPYKNYFFGTVAYLIKKSAARRFLAEVSKNGLPFWLADDFILFGRDFDLDIQIVRPLLVIENPTINSNLEGVRGSVFHSLTKKLLKYPAKKLLAVLRNWGK